MPKLIAKALKNPKRYSPLLSAKIKIVTVPGQGTTPALSTTPISVLRDFSEHPPQLQLGGWAEKERMCGFSWLRLMRFIKR